MSKEQRLKIRQEREDYESDLEERARLARKRPELLNLKSGYRCCACDLEHQPHLGIRDRRSSAASRGRLILTGQSRGWQFYFGAAACPMCLAEAEFDLGGSKAMDIADAFNRASDKYRDTGASDYDFPCHSCGAPPESECTDICPNPEEKTHIKRFPPEDHELEARVLQIIKAQKKRFEMNQKAGFKDGAPSIVDMRDRSAFNRQRNR